MEKILLATRNKDKIAEIKEILKDLDIQLLTAYDFPKLPEVIEDRSTIAGNAIKKATESANFSGFPTLADDTGLFVNALNDAPGVYSARYAGENCSYKDNRLKLLQEMNNITEREAEFRTVVAFAFPGKLIATAEGKVLGKITRKEIGANGFGYDAIFRAIETGKTFGEMTREEKEKISHRGRAFQKIIKVIKSEPRIDTDQ